MNGIQVPAGIGLNILMGQYILMVSLFRSPLLPPFDHVILSAHSAISGSRTEGNSFC